MSNNVIVYSTQPEDADNDEFFKNQLARFSGTKQAYSNKDEATVCRKPDGSLRDTYLTEKEAKAQASISLLMHRNRLNIYRCTKCEGWHLCSGDRKPCSLCKKMSYESEYSAKKQASVIFKNRGVTLTTYCCPHGQGIHLTSCK